jgi:hypothetical protein
VKQDEGMQVRKASSPKLMLASRSILCYTREIESKAEDLTMPKRL